MRQSAAVPHPEAVLVEFFGNTHRLDRRLPDDEGPKYAKRRLSKAGVGEDTPHAHQPDVGFDDHEGMHRISRLDLVGPTAFGRLAE